jgi:HK97 family phage major capsid protein
MKVQIRLKKTWENGGTDYPEGQVLQLEENNAKWLCDQGIAEVFIPETGDQIKESNIDTPEASIPKAQIEEYVKELMAKNSDFIANSDKEDPYLKTAGYSGMHEFAYDVWKAQTTRSYSEKLSTWDSRVKGMVSKAPENMGNLIDADGGFLVPDEFRSTLLRNSVENSVILNRTTRIPMANNTVEIPTVVESSRATSIYGGIIVYRPAEGASITKSNPKFGRVKLQLSKLAALCYVTSELMEDSPISIEPLLNQMFSEAIGFQLDEDIINGTGANQALGMLNAPALISVAKESGQAADTIETKNITKMWSRLMARSQGGAVWYANQDTFPQLAELALAVGTGGSSAGLLQPATEGLVGRPRQTLLGSPIFFTEHSQTLGDKGDLLLCDPSQYLVGQKAGGGIRMASSIHLKFDEDETAFRFITRYDGKPWMQTALTPKHSTKTLSSFVTLAARA